MGYLSVGATLGINCAYSICAYFTTKYSIQNLGDMFIAANLSGMDLCKIARPKMWVWIAVWDNLSFIWTWKNREKLPYSLIFLFRNIDQKQWELSPVAYFWLQCFYSYQCHLFQYQSPGILSLAINRRSSLITKWAQHISAVDNYD